MLKQDFSKVITFDGTSGSGKGTIASRIAKHYGYAYLDTGKLYRALALLIIKHSDRKNYIKDLNFLVGKITQDILSSNDLYSEEVTDLSSKVAADTEVRESLFSFQRDFILSNNSVVLDGRDTGSVICPEAKNKFYVDADLDIRSKRRYQQNKQFYDNNKISIAEIKVSLDMRDKRDKERQVAPLIIPKGANIIDNSGDGLDNVIKKIIDILDKG